MQKQQNQSKRCCRIGYQILPSIQPLFSKFNEQQFKYSERIFEDKKQEEGKEAQTYLSDTVKAQITFHEYDGEKMAAVSFKKLEVVFLQYFEEKIYHIGTSIKLLQSDR